MANQGQSLSSRIRVALGITMYLALIILCDAPRAIATPGERVRQGIRVVRMRAQGFTQNIRSQLGLPSGSTAGLVGGNPLNVNPLNLPIAIIPPPPDVHSIPPVEEKCESCAITPQMQSPQTQVVNSISNFGGTGIASRVIGATGAGGIFSSVTNSISGGLQRMVSAWSSGLQGMIPGNGSIIGGVSQSFGRLGQISQNIGNLSNLASRFKNALLGNLAVSQFNNFSLSRLKLPFQGGGQLLSGRFANFLASNPLSSLSGGLRSLGTLFQTTVSGALLSKMTGGSFSQGALAGMIRGSLQPLRLPLAFPSKLQGLAGQFRNTLLGALSFKAPNPAAQVSSAMNRSRRFVSLMRNNPVLRLPTNLRSLGVGFSNALYGALFSQLGGMNQRIANTTGAVKRGLAQAPALPANTSARLSNSNAIVQSAVTGSVSQGNTYPPIQGDMEELDEF